MMKNNQRRIPVRLRFRLPVTYRLLFDACTALDIDVDEAIEDPREALKDVSPTVPQYQAFLDVVLKPARRVRTFRRPKLEEMPVDQALALGAGAATDFFLHTWLTNSQRLVAS